MSIGNMPEDELDNLFRKAASEYNPEFDPEAWQAMEKKLGPPKPTPAKNWRRGGLMALILFIGLGSWFGYQALPETAEKTSNNKIKPAAGISETNELAIKGDNTASNSATTGISTRETGKAESFKNLNKTKNIAGNNNSKALPEAAKTNLVVDNQIIASQSRAKVKQKGKNIAEVSVNNLAILNNTDRKRNKITQTVDNTNTKLIAETANVPTPDSAVIIDSAGTKALVVAAGSPDLVATVSPAGPDSSLLIPKKVLADSAVVKEKKTLLNLSRFTFSLVAAPDLTSVGFAHVGGISTNAGLLVGYNLSPKWRITTGLISARKIYQALPADYGNEYEFWKNRHKPDDIEAVCRVLDIPINLGYQVWQQGRNNLIINTGLSSYLMRREKYTYEYYPYGGNNGYTSNWQVKNQNKHLFSIYNLSVGYGRELKRGVLIGVEPFVKIPLAGVGAGKIKLASAGVFGSLSYRFTQ